MIQAAERTKNIWSTDIALLIDETKKAGAEWSGTKQMDNKAKDIILTAARGAAISNLASSLDVPESYIPSEAREKLFGFDGRWGGPELDQHHTITDRSYFILEYPANTSGEEIVSIGFQSLKVVYSAFIIIEVEKSSGPLDYTAEFIHPPQGGLYFRPKDSEDSERYQNFCAIEKFFQGLKQRELSK